MNIFKTLALVIAVIITVCVVNTFFYCISLASTAANVFGPILLLVWGYILYSIIKRLLKS